MAGRSESSEGWLINQIDDDIYGHEWRSSTGGRNFIKLFSIAEYFFNVAAGAMHTWSMFHQYDNLQ